MDRGRGDSGDKAFMLEGWLVSVCRCCETKIKMARVRSRCNLLISRHVAPPPRDTPLVIQAARPWPRGAFLSSYWQQTHRGAFNMLCTVCSGDIISNRNAQITRLSRGKNWVVAGNKEGELQGLQLDFFFFFFKSSVKRKCSQILKNNVILDYFGIIAQIFYFI